MYLAADHFRRFAGVCDPTLDGSMIMADVFISYCRADFGIVRCIAENIDAYGFQSWWDRYTLPGQEFDREIERNILDAKCVVVVWSIHSVDSRWVRAEASDALDKRKLIPTQIDDCRIPLEFRRIQTAQLMGWKGDRSHQEFRQLMSGIRSFVGVAGDAGAKGSSQSRRTTTAWRVEAKSFDWNAARFTLVQAENRHSIEYRNHFSHESLCVDGAEICRGGSTRFPHPAFQFYIQAAGEPSTCIVEPVYTRLGKLLTARLFKLKVTVDGKVLPEVTR